MKFKLRNQNQTGAAPILIVIIIVTILAIGGVVWYVATRNNDDAGNKTEETQQTTVIEGDMFKAASQGQALECDWELDYDGPAAIAQGKFYTDGTNGRSEARYEYDGQTYQALAIINEDRTYHWSEPVRGTKIQGISDVRSKYEAREPKYDLLKDAVDVDFNAAYKFTCTPWTVDESVFVAPGDLQFLILE